ncbi:uncharacterized protein G2W53_017598 [Senna tora]|uniref:Uncharacterized protein n=1 Tax=Senna tora TaxID=362788 RepID=A0A834TRJ3_9FABA|nr:uncharacterized protein G2W53_017598 [Senna tora]
MAKTRYSDKIEPTTRSSQRGIPKVPTYKAKGTPKKVPVYKAKGTNKSPSL